MVTDAVQIYERELWRARSALFALLDGLTFSEVSDTPKKQIEVNQVRYKYLIDPKTLLATVKEMMLKFLGVTEEEYANLVGAAYEAGAAESDISMRTLLDDTRAYTQLLVDDPFLQRAAYVKARVFEEMKGFNGVTASRLGTLLVDGLTEGKSIRAIKATLRESFDISTRRAETIARTEVIGALRRGRLEQSEDTAKKFGVEVGMLWISALSPTTRRSHAARHGKVWTPDEVREFYTVDGNAINCKCAQVEAIMKDGKPLQAKLVARETERRQRFLGEPTDG